MPNKGFLSVVVIVISVIMSATMVFAADNIDPALAKDTFAIGMNPERNYLVLVNDDNAYSFDGDYDQALQPDLVYIADYQGEATPIEKGANTAFSMLKQYLFERGIFIEILSAYRTKEDQQFVCEEYGNLEGWSDTNKVPKPGYSEHHTGLLLDVVIWWPMLGEWATETSERQENAPSFFEPIHSVLPDYGFIDRYPPGKEEITGYPSEPYEIRFVGSSKIAHDIMDNGLCLEEYLATK